MPSEKAKEFAAVVHDMMKRSELYFKRKKLIPSINVAVMEEYNDVSICDQFESFVSVMQKLLPDFADELTAAYEKIGAKEGVEQAHFVKVDEAKQYMSSALYQDKLDLIRLNKLADQLMQEDGWSLIPQSSSRKNERCFAATVDGKTFSFLLPTEIEESENGLAELVGHRAEHLKLFCLFLRKH